MEKQKSPPGAAGFGWFTKEGALVARYTSGTHCRRWVEFHHQRQVASAFERIDRGAAPAASPKVSPVPSNIIIFKLTGSAPRVKPSHQSRRSSWQVPHVRGPFSGKIAGAGSPTRINGDGAKCRRFARSIGDRRIAKPGISSIAPYLQRHFAAHLQSVQVQLALQRSSISFWLVIIILPSRDCEGPPDKGGWARAA